MCLRAGWTLAFADDATVDYSDSNLPAYMDGTASAVTSANQVLLGVASEVGASGVALVSDPSDVLWAVIEKPAAWDVFPSATWSATVNVDVYLSSGVTESRNLWYGRANADNCGDAWYAGSSMWGKICVEGTKAPFYNGYVPSLLPPPV